MVTKSQLAFIKELTNINNSDKAIVHFYTSCLKFFLLPSEILEKVNPKTVDDEKWLKQISKKLEESKMDAIERLLENIKRM